MHKSLYPYLLITSTALATAGCPALPGLRSAEESFFGALVEALGETLLRFPANVRASSDLQCDSPEICDGEGNPLATECTLESDAWNPAIAEPLIACALRCEDTDCVAEASEEAGLQAPEDMLDRCLMATSACEVETDACEALAAGSAAIREAIDACHREPCDSLRGCLAGALLGEDVPSGS